MYNILTMSMDRACAVNISMVHEPQSTQEVTQWVANIIDAKYKKTDIQSVVSTNITEISLQDQIS